VKGHIDRGYKNQVWSVGERKGTEALPLIPESKYFCNLKSIYLSRRI
jgi:hypothetical protein